MPEIAEIRHVAIILDGNRRYAKKTGQIRLMGHKKGAERVRELISEWAPSMGIKELTLYTFSMQNFGREKSEVEYLMGLFVDFFWGIAESELMQRDIKIEFIGRREMFDLKIQQIMSKLEDKTKANSGLVVRFAMAYGGREEIVDAVNKIIEIRKRAVVEGWRELGGEAGEGSGEELGSSREGAMGGGIGGVRTEDGESVVVRAAGVARIGKGAGSAVSVRAAEIKANARVTMEELSRSMYVDSEPDIIIRTGGDKRTSNFLMWQSWYSEWFFVEKFWPEFSREDLEEICREFAQRKRNFGK